MSEKEVRMEICKVFAKPMGLCVVTEEGDLLPFKYLQRTGAGSRTLCVPSVATTFEWNGRQVSTLAKSGGIIYILADSTMPALTEDCEYSSCEEDNELPKVTLPGHTEGSGVDEESEGEEVVYMGSTTTHTDEGPNPHSFGSASGFPSTSASSS